MRAQTTRSGRQAAGVSGAERPGSTKSIRLQPIVLAMFDRTILNGWVMVLPLIESSIPALLERLALQQPDDVAFTFIDYEVDPAGFAESLTWSQVHQRARVV